MLQAASLASFENCVQAARSQFLQAVGLQCFLACSQAAKLPCLQAVGLQRVIKTARPQGLQALGLQRYQPPPCRIYHTINSNKNTIVGFSVCFVEIWLSKTYNRNFYYCEYK